MLIDDWSDKIKISLENIYPVSQSGLFYHIFRCGHQRLLETARQPRDTSVGLGLSSQELRLGPYQPLRIRISVATGYCKESLSPQFRASWALVVTVF